MKKKYLSLEEQAEMASLKKWLRDAWVDFWNHQDLCKEYSPFFYKKDPDPIRNLRERILEFGYFEVSRRINLSVDDAEKQLSKYMTEEEIRAFKLEITAKKTGITFDPNAKPKPCLLPVP